MVSISPARLHAIGAVARTIGNGTETAGRLSAARTVHLSHLANGRLQVRLTDGLLKLNVLVPVEGDEASWAATIDSWRLSELARCLGASRWQRLPAGPWPLGAVKSMSVVTMQPVSDGVLAVERDDFHGRVPIVQRQDSMEPSSPTEQSPACEVPFRDFGAAIQFLSWGLGRGTGDDPLQVCTFFPDGWSFAAKRLAYLAAASPPMPFPISLRKTHLRKLAALIRYARKMAVLNDNDTLTITKLAAAAGDEIQISDTNGNITLTLPSIERPFLREAIEQSCQEPPTLIAQVDRKSFAYNANLLGATAYRQRLILTLQPIEEGVTTLKIVQEGTARAGLSSNQFVCFISKIGPMNSTVPSFRVSARAILESVTQFTAHLLSIVFRPPYRMIEVRNADLDAERTHKVFLHVEPVQ